MTYLDALLSASPISTDDITHETADVRTSLVLVLEDGERLSGALRALCAFLDVAIERLDSDEPLLPFLQRYRPMAVVAPMEAEGQDGANVLMTVAEYDRSLPVLLLSDGDASLAGAADAVAELWGLTSVVQSVTWPRPGVIAEFLCRAGAQGRCLGMMPI